MTRGAILATGSLTFTLFALLCIPRHLPQSSVQTSVSTATFHARIEPGSLTLRGSLPTQSSKDLILKKARDLYGTGQVRVVDQLSVDAQVGSATWIESIPAILPALRQLTERGSIIIDGRSLVLSGQARNQSAKAALLQTIAPVQATGLEIEDHVLAAMPATSTSAASTSSVQASVNKILARGSIEFESNSATITDRGQVTLDKLVVILRQSPTAAIEISGHTDSYGAPDYNRELSQRRADAVRRYFVRQGLANPLTAVGYGASRPFSSAKDRSGLQQNRRIELRVKGSGEL